MFTQVCNSCGGDEFYTKKNGPHRGKYCTGCGAWKCWIPGNWQDFIWPIGKTHKNKKLGDIIQVDRRYVEWAAENLKGSLQKRAKEALENAERKDYAEEQPQQDIFNPTEPSKDGITVRDMPW
jgi:hypothetical protein